ncbi:MAG TPA: ATP-binding protein [Ignavibacteria bacterium]|nr:ATP-binding protein [Ignavibacteria bacterium]
MTRKQLIKLIEEGENLNVEFKQRFSSEEKIAKEMLAFANTKGGIIIFGVADDGKICGVHSEKGEAELIKTAAEKYCEPPLQYSIEFLNIGSDELVIVHIPESKNKPNRIQDFESKININTAHVYVRVNDKSVLASKEMIKILQSRTNDTSLVNYTISKNEKLVFELLENKDSVTVKELAGKANISNRRASRTLINMVRANLLYLHHKDNGEEFFTSV